MQGHEMGGFKSRLIWWCAAIALASIKCVQCDTGRTQVHVITTNHLDIGFDGLGNQFGTVDNVINRYFKEYYPQAIRTASKLREAGGQAQSKYMTHTWLVSLYMDCPPNMGFTCPNATELKAFDAAVRRGDIWWHAYPHNAQMEFMDESMLSFGVEMTHELDNRFGLTPKITLSQRDVPGMSRSAIVPLTRAGVKAISVGVNPASAPPAVPPYQPFWWKDVEADTSILAMWHPGGYSGWPVDLSPECAQVEGFNHVLCAAWKGDNAGPHSIKEIKEILNITNHGFPDADVFVSTFDNFTQHLVEAAASLQLPVVTQELGDTWVWGVSSDPDKVARYKEMLRYRATIQHLSDTAAFKNFSRLLIKIPEHTWGLDTREALPDFTDWDNVNFHRLLAAKSPMFELTTASWLEQKRFVDYAIEALEPLQANAAQRAIKMLHRGWAEPRPAKNAWTRAPASEAQHVFESRYWSIQLDPITGAVEGLTFKWGEQAGTQWADPDNRLGNFMYSQYVEEDFTEFLNTYLYMEVTPDNSWWVLPDLSKPGISKDEPPPRRLDLLTNSSEVFVKQNSKDSFHVLIKSTVMKWAVKNAGAPETVWLDVRSKAGDPDLYIDVVVANKTATRLPEALWFTFTPNPKVADASSWQMYKIQRPVSPLDVVLNGSQSLHAVTDEGVTVKGVGANAWEQLQILSLDAPVLSPGYPEIFPVLEEKPDMEQGVSFNLMNNIWGTNYVMWSPYEPVMKTMRFRFVLRMHNLTAGSPTPKALKPKYKAPVNAAPVQAEAPAALDENLAAYPQGVVAALLGHAAAPHHAAVESAAPDDAQTDGTEQHVTSVPRVNNDPPLEKPVRVAFDTYAVGGDRSSVYNLRMPRKARLELDAFAG